MSKHSRYREKKQFAAFGLLIATGIAVSTVCVWVLLQTLYTQKRSQTYYAVMSHVAKESSEASKRVAIDTATNAAEEAEETAKHADTNAERASYVDFDALRKISPGVIAWIQREGTEIDYPVVQGTDNAYYLSHLPDGSKNSLGSIFMDYRNKPDFKDMNTVIYGHNMASGAMFGTIERYKSQVFYDEHPTISIYTPENDYVLELLAGYVADAAFEKLPLYFENTTDFDAYIQEIRQRSAFASDIDVSAADRLVTLCTCTFDFSNARFILVGRLTG